MLNKNKANQINLLANDMLKNSVPVYKVMALIIDSERGSLTHRKAINQLSEQHGMKMCTPEGKRPNYYKMLHLFPPRPRKFYFRCNIVLRVFFSENEVVFARLDSATSVARRPFLV